MMIRYGVRLTTEVIDQVLSALDQALLLENARFVEAVEKRLGEFRSAPYREPGSAGNSYPADADELHRSLQAYMDEVESDDPAPVSSRGVISPHIDFARGGPVYARVWKRAQAMAQAADIAVIVGTDHSGADGRVTLTRQHYATPYGTLPTARDIVDSLAESVGPESAFADELHHRTEHSIELAAVWLHHVRGGEACEVVPILCGSFSQFLKGEGSPGQDASIAALVDSLAETTRGRRALYVAAADLAHVGPAFGGAPVDFAARARLEAVDNEIIEHLCAGDADGFFQAIKSTGGRNNVCGLAPIYLTLRVLAPTTGDRVAYDRCPADAQGTSLVSICGVVLK
jgi:AmmeMemoRadiSam system protein B